MCGGVVHNIAYLRFIEIARTLLAEKLGMKLVEMAETQRYPVVVRTEIDYRRAAKLGDRLRIEGWLDRLERVRFWCGFQIRRARAMTCSSRKAARCSRSSKCRKRSCSACRKSGNAIAGLSRHRRVR